MALHVNTSQRILAYEFPRWRSYPLGKDCMPILAQVSNAIGQTRDLKLLERFERRNRLATAQIVQNLLRLTHLNSASITPTSSHLGPAPLIIQPLGVT